MSFSPDLAKWVDAEIGRVRFRELSGDDAVEARSVARLERRQVGDDQHSGSGSKAGDAAAGEVERDAVGESHAAKAQRLRGARVFQFDELEIVARIAAAGRIGRMIHHFGDSQILLRKRGIAGRGQRRDDDCPRVSSN